MKVYTIIRCYPKRVPEVAKASRLLMLKFLVEHNRFLSPLSMFKLPLGMNPATTTMRRNMIKILVGGILGAIVGAGIGYAGKCAGGTCPLTCNPIGGIITGILVGILLAFSTVIAKDKNK